MKGQHLYQGDTVAFGKTTEWVCCDCGATHRIAFKQKGGLLFAKIHYLRRKTAKQREKMKRTIKYAVRHLGAKPWLFVESRIFKWEWHSLVSQQVRLRRGRE